MPVAVDAIVVGSGPNGLAAAITIARAGRSVRVYEAEATIGGGARSEALTLPGFVHDFGAAVMAFLEGSPFFRGVPLKNFGLELVHPDAPFAHPLDDGSAVMAERTVEATAAGLGATDGRTYRDRFAWFASSAIELMDGLLHLPRISHPGIVASFGVRGIRAASPFAQSTFQTERARALFAGAAGPAAATGASRAIAAGQFHDQRRGDHRLAGWLCAGR